jgi:flavodoxin
MLLCLCFTSLLIFSNQIDPKRALIIYFSIVGENKNVEIAEKGNTEIVVDYIKEKTNIKSYKIIPEKPYPENYSECLEIFKHEKESNSRPKINEPIKNINYYDTIILGYPRLVNIPNIVITLLESLDFSGKTVYPFIIHEDLETGKIINEIIKYTKNATVNKGFLLKGFNAKTIHLRDDIDYWLINTLKINVSKNITQEDSNMNSSDSDFNYINDDTDNEFNIILKPKKSSSSRGKKAVKIMLYILGGLVGLMVLLVIAITVGKDCR